MTRLIGFWVQIQEVNLALKHGVILKSKTKSPTILEKDEIPLLMRLAACMAAFSDRLPLTSLCGNPQTLSMRQKCAHV